MGLASEIDEQAGGVDGHNPILTLTLSLSLTTLTLALQTGGVDDRGH